MTDQVVRRAGGDDFLGRAAREQFAEGDVRQAVAALRLVHVVRGDQEGQALGGEPVDLLPEIAARLRVHAGGRLVEQKQFRLVDQAGGERQALLPAAGELAGQLVPPRGQPEPVEALGARPARRSGTEYIRATKSRFSEGVRSS